MYYYSLVYISITPINKGLYILIEDRQRDRDGKARPREKKNKKNIIKRGTCQIDVR